MAMKTAKGHTKERESLLLADLYAGLQIQVSRNARLAGVPDGTVFRMRRSTDRSRGSIRVAKQAITI